MNRWEMEQKIAIKAIKDPEFMKKLLKDPKKALSELFKNEKNAHFDQVKIKVEQEKKNEWIIPIPLVEKAESLSDEQLLQMTGGVGVDSIIGAGEVKYSSKKPSTYS